MNESSSDDDDEAAQASVVPHVDSDDELPGIPELLHESASDFKDFRVILRNHGLDKERPGNLINKYECVQCASSLTDFICEKEKSHRICFRCGRFMQFCPFCKHHVARMKNLDDLKDDVVAFREIKEIQDMFSDFRQLNPRRLDVFLKKYGPEIPLDRGSFARKYLKYKQKYLALKNMRL